MYVNSGFQALINIVNEEYSNHFLLLFTRESTETITNRYITITAVAVFLGIFAAVVINMLIFNDMLFFFVLILTFLPLQIGIYIGKYPSLLSLLMLFFSYFSILFLKRSGHFLFAHPDKKEAHYTEKVKKNSRLVSDRSNSRNMLELCCFALIIALFFSLFGSATVSRSSLDSVSSGPMKSKVDSYVKVFVQNGFAGFYNRYQATGGISNGRLGGMGSVRPDYQTDLTLTFVPYAYETVYLKAYTGSSWLESYNPQTAYISSNAQVEKELSTSSDDYSQFAAFAESHTLLQMMQKNIVPSMSAQMIIRNEGAAVDHLYLPYYSIEEIDSSYSTSNKYVDGVLPVNASMKVGFVPYSPSQTDLDDRSQSDYLSYDNSNEKLFSAYQQECYDNYLDIPDDIRSEISSYHEKIGTGNSLADQIFKIRAFLTSEYDYSLTPGATPKDEDFVTYFLGTQKRGYCAHFASAATLLLRSYGIPARYVEGYAVTSSEIASRAVESENDPDAFFQGENVLGSQPVVEVEVSDGDAHAWVEVFVDGFGWIPVEVTPATDEEEEVSNYSDFLSALSTLFGAGGNPDSSQTSNASDATSPDISLNQNLSLSSPVVAVFCLLLLLALLFPVCLRFWKRVNAHRRLLSAYKNGSYAPLISHSYRIMLCKLKHTYPAAGLILPADVARLLSTLSVDDADRKYIAILKKYQPSDFVSFMELCEKACYSSESITKEEADSVLGFLRMFS